MKLSTRNIEAIKENPITGRYELPLHGSQATIREVTFNRWSKFDKDRMYINIRAKKREWQAGYIDLETGDLVPEHRHQLEFEDAIVILYTIIADLQAHEQILYEIEHPEFDTFAYDMTNDINRKVEELEAWLGVEDVYEPDFSLEPTKTRWQATMQKQRKAKRNHLHALKIALATGKKRGSLKCSGVPGQNNVNSYEGLLEAIRGETEYEYI